MKAVGIIPARMGSSRFPGKPLTPILGRPMVEHVYRRCVMSERLDEVYVATCDTEIEDAVSAFGGKAVMTSDRHERASDREAEAASAIDAGVYVMIQGDEPTINPEMIDQALAPILEEEGVQCVNLMKRIECEEEFENRDVIKVVTDCHGFALLMSREPIPTRNKLKFVDIVAHKQVCIIPFTRAGLELYATLEPTLLEIVESIDMLRFLEHGHKVRMVETAYESLAVDRPHDVAPVEELLDGDELSRLYLGTGRVS